MIFWLTSLYFLANNVKLLAIGVVGGGIEEEVEDVVEELILIEVYNNDNNCNDDNSVQYGNMKNLLD